MVILRGSLKARGQLGARDTEPAGRCNERCKVEVIVIAPVNILYIFFRTDINAYASD